MQGKYRWALGLFLLAGAARAQTVNAASWTGGSIEVVEGWRAHQGDDPGWAKSSYDDRAWQPVKLDELGASRPGWQWFRLHLRLPPGHAHAHLLIVGGGGIYTAYVNGQEDGETRLRPWYALRRPVEQVIPLANDEDEFFIALRTHAVPNYTLWHLPLFLTAAVGTADAIDNERAAFESQRLYQAVPSIAINLAIVFAGLAMFALSFSQPDHREYRWLGFYLTLLGVSNGFLNASASGVVPMVFNNLLGDPLILVFTIMQIEFTFSFAGYRLGRGWRIYETILALTALMPALVTLGWIPITPYVLAEALAILPAALVLPVVLLLWYRGGNREAGWLILPSLLPAATAALYDLGSASIFAGWVRADFLAEPILLGPVSLQVADAGDLLFVLAIGVVMFFRFTRVNRERTRVAAELEAARQMQQRLVPARLPEMIGYALEAAYFPALEVGGDFYQVLDQSDGGKLLVLGDVSGKGLKAAMTGTLALGVLRTLASEGLSPAAVLTRLNRHVKETAEDGFITCVCAHLARNGDLTVANAGHLLPYRNGEELVLVPDLPLGIAAELNYEEAQFRLVPGDRLMLLSDGVVEARDTRGRLFGFERTRALSRQTADTIARAALDHGQEDDITVLTIERR
jgi:phosphoserine phosphatase RsbU/P